MEGCVEAGGGDQLRSISTPAREPREPEDPERPLKVPRDIRKIGYRRMRQTFGLTQAEMWRELTVLYKHLGLST